MELKICHLYADVMNLSGDRGNVICMEKRLQWRDIDVQTDCVTIGDELDLSAYDLLFVGNGQPFDNNLLLEDAVQKAPQIVDAVESGLPVLAVCGGYQLLGKSYETVDGTILAGIGALDVTTKCTAKRLVGDTFTCTDPETTVVGFENHAGRTWLHGEVRPLGMTTEGHGNNGEDGTEGARYKNVFATYAHGCLLPKNPALCDHILKIALKRKYGTVDMIQLDDSQEMSAHDYMCKRLEK